MFAQIKKDIDAIMLRDPAAKSRLEAALCYPGLHAIWLHRIAHHFYLKGWVVFPRVLNTFSRLVYQHFYQFGFSILKLNFFPAQNCYFSNTDK